MVLGIFYLFSQLYMFAFDNLYMLEFLDKKKDVFPSVKLFGVGNFYVFSASLIVNFKV